MGKNKPQRKTLGTVRWISVNKIQNVPEDTEEKWLEVVRRCCQEICDSLDPPIREQHIKANLFGMVNCCCAAWKWEGEKSVDVNSTSAEEAKLSKSSIKIVKEQCLHCLMMVLDINPSLKNENKLDK